MAPWLVHCLIQVVHLWCTAGALLDTGTKSVVGHVIWLVHCCLIQAPKAWCWKTSQAPNWALASLEKFLGSSEQGSKMGVGFSSWAIYRWLGSHSFRVPRMLTYAVRWFQTTKKTGSIQMTRKGVSFQGSLYRTKLEGPPSNFVLWSWGFESVSGAEPEFLLTQDMRQPWDSFLIAANVPQMQLIFRLNCKLKWPKWPLLRGSCFLKIFNVQYILMEWIYDKQAFQSDRSGQQVSEYHLRKRPLLHYSHLEDVVLGFLQGLRGQLVMRGPSTQDPGSDSRKRHTTADHLHRAD